MFHLCRSTGTCPSGWFQFVLAGCGSCGPTSAPPRPELGFERPTAVIANRPAAMRGARLAGAAVVVALDRLGRFLSGVIRTLEDLTAAGVLLRSPREGIDYAISAGKVLAGIFAALAGYERDLMHERAAAARHAARARGQHVGRPPGSPPGRSGRSTPCTPPANRFVRSRRPSGSAAAPPTAPCKHPRRGPRPRGEHRNRRPDKAP